MVFIYSVILFRSKGLHSTHTLFLSLSHSHTHPPEQGRLGQTNSPKRPSLVEVVRKVEVDRTSGRRFIQTPVFIPWPSLLIFRKIVEQDEEEEISSSSSFEDLASEIVKEDWICDVTRIFIQNLRNVLRQRKKVFFSIIVFSFKIIFFNFALFREDRGRN